MPIWCQIFEYENRGKTTEAREHYYFNWNHTDAKWKWYKPRFVFVTVGMQRGLGNNIQQLKEKSINDVKSQVFDTATTRIDTSTPLAIPALKRVLTTVRPP